MKHGDDGLGEQSLSFEDEGEEVSTFVGGEEGFISRLFAGHTIRSSLSLVLGGGFAEGISSWRGDRDIYECCGAESMKVNHGAIWANGVVTLEISRFGTEGDKAHCS